MFTNRWKVNCFIDLQIFKVYHINNTKPNLYAFDNVEYNYMKSTNLFNVMKNWNIQRKTHTNTNFTFRIFPCSQQYFLQMPILSLGFLTKQLLRLILAEICIPKYHDIQLWYSHISGWIGTEFCLKYHTYIFPLTLLSNSKLLLESWVPVISNAKHKK